MNDIFVSIIIPVYNDWDRLAICLQALSGQSYPRHLFEIIVVNNNPEDHIPPNFLIPGNCIIIREERPGSYAARNTGIRLSKGKIIGFTDSDCIPGKDWIKNAVDYLQADKAVSRVAGRIDLIYQSAKLTPGELYEKIYAFNQHLYVKKNGTGVTANMFSHSYVFESIGLFNEGLLSGGDHEWGIRAMKANYAIGYGNEVVISHPARSSVKDLVKKAKRVGGGHALFRARPANKIIAAVYLINHLRPPIRTFRMVNRKGRDLSIGQKLTVVGIQYYLSVVTSWEKFKVQIGKLPNRT